MSAEETVEPTISYLYSNSESAYFSEYRMATGADMILEGDGMNDGVKSRRMPSAG